MKRAFLYTIFVSLFAQPAKPCAISLDTVLYFNLYLGKLGFRLLMWKIYGFENPNIQNMRSNYQ